MFDLVAGLGHEIAGVAALLYASDSIHTNRLRFAACRTDVPCLEPQALNADTLPRDIDLIISAHFQRVHWPKNAPQGLCGRDRITSPSRSTRARSPQRSRRSSPADNAPASPAPRPTVHARCDRRAKYGTYVRDLPPLKKERDTYLYSSRPKPIPHPWLVDDPPLVCRLVADLLTQVAYVDAEKLCIFGILGSPNVRE